MGALDLMRRDAMTLRASSLEDPAIPITSSKLVQILGGEPTWTGVQVNSQKAITYVAMMKCARVLAEGLAQLPLQVFEHLERGRRKAYEHPMYRLLYRKPNPEMTSFYFREVAMYHLAFFGNFYAERELSGAGELLGLWPLRPDRTTPERINGGLIYRTWVRESVNGPEKEKGLPAHRVFHVAGPGFDGLKGLNPVSVMKQSIGLGLALEEYAARLFSNGAMGRFLLKFPAGSRISKEARGQLKEEFEMLQQGLRQAHRTATLEEGIGIEKLSFDPKEAQMLESRLFQERQIAGFMRVPPHMVGDLERATFSNIEHQGLEFIQYSEGPWIVRWEQVLDGLFTEEDQDRFYCRFNVDGLLRGDFKSRVDGQVAQVQNGLRSPDECREQDEMNPREDELGGKYWMPANYLFADAAASEPDGGAGRQEALRKKDPGNPQARVQAAAITERYRKNYEGLMAAVYGDLVRNEVAAVGKMLDRAEVDGFAAVQAQMEKFYGGLEQKAAHRLSPLMIGLAGIVASDLPAPPQLDRFAAEVAGGMARRYAETSMRQLLQAAATGERAIDGMRALLEEWGSSRAAAEAFNESTRAVEAFAAEAQKQAMKGGAPCTTES